MEEKTAGCKGLSFNSVGLPLLLLHRPVANMVISLVRGKRPKEVKPQKMGMETAEPKCFQMLPKVFKIRRQSEDSRSENSAREASVRVSEFWKHREASVLVFDI